MGKTTDSRYPTSFYRPQASTVQKIFTEWYFFSLKFGNEPK